MNAIDNSFGTYWKLIVRNSLGARQKVLFKNIVGTSMFLISFIWNLLETHWKLIRSLLKGWCMVCIL